MTPCFLKNIYFENSVIWLTLLWNCPEVFIFIDEKSAIGATHLFKKNFKCDVQVHKYIVKNIANKLNDILCIQ